MRASEHLNRQFNSLDTPVNTAATATRMPTPHESSPTSRPRSARPHAPRRAHLNADGSRGRQRRRQRQGCASERTVAIRKAAVEGARATKGDGAVPRPAARRRRRVAAAGRSRRRGATPAFCGMIDMDRRQARPLRDRRAHRRRRARCRPPRSWRRRGRTPPRVYAAQGRRQELGAGRVPRAASASVHDVPTRRGMFPDMPSCASRCKPHADRRTLHIAPVAPIHARSTRCHAQQRQFYNGMEPLLVAGDRAVSRGSGEEEPHRPHARAEGHRARAASASAPTRRRRSCRPGGARRGTRAYFARRAGRAMGRPPIARRARRRSIVASGSAEGLGVRGVGRVEVELERLATGAEFCQFAQDPFARREKWRSEPIIPAQR